MTTRRQDDEFREQVIPSTLLEQSLEWIANHMEPGDVFTHQNESKLASWAQANGYVSQSVLEQWALDNGYVFEE